MPENASDQHESENTVAVRLSWVGLEDEPIYVANQFASQFDTDLFYLSFGLATPPLLLGSPERSTVRSLATIGADTSAAVKRATKKMVCRTPTPGQ